MGAPECQQGCYQIAISRLLYYWKLVGKRDLNPGPQRPERCALQTEPLPDSVLLYRREPVTKSRANLSAVSPLVSDEGLADNAVIHHGAHVDGILPYVELEEVLVQALQGIMTSTFPKTSPLSFLPDIRASFLPPTESDSALMGLASTVKLTPFMSLLSLQL